MERTAQKKRITKQQKSEAIERLRKQFVESKGIVIATQKGMSVAETTKVKKDLAKFEASFRVTKNRFLKKATREAFHTFISGSTVVVSCSSDHGVMPMLKYMVTLAKENGKISISGGLAYGAVMSAGEIVALSKLPAREELLAQLMGVMTAPVGAFQRAITAPLSAMLSILNQLRDRNGSQQKTHEEGQPS